MQKQKKTRLKKQNIFIFVNVIVLVIITCFYAFRLIHFYRIENPKLEEKESLNSLLTLKKNIVTFGDGLYKEDDEYIFKGKEVNNYVYYSGRVFRILSIDSEGGVRLVTEDSQTLMAFDIKGGYEDSYVRSWLNKQDNVSQSGKFYASLNNPENFLTTTTVCVDVLKESETKCSKTVKDTVGLLSKKDYEDALGMDSYLNIGSYFWLSNVSTDGAWYVYTRGKINNIVGTGTNYYSYGVRPVITFKKNLEVKDGDGSKERPYVVEESTNSILNLKSVGEYISYSGMNFRILEKDFNHVKVVLDGFIKENGTEYKRSFSANSNIFTPNSDIGYYLNSKFYNTLEHQDYLVSGNLSTDRYDSSTSYDYKKIYQANVDAKIGLLQVGDLFLSDYSDYFLSTRTSSYENTVYKVVNEGKLYADLATNISSIRPVLFLKPEIKIASGKGSQDDPFVLE